MPPMLTFASDAARGSDAAFEDCALDLMARFLGLPIDRAAGSTGSVDVYYGNDTDRACALRIPRVDAYAAADVPGVPSAAEAPRADAPFPFDLFAAVRFWIADEGNPARPDGAYDRHDRLGADRSVQQALGVLETPIVNAYLVLFGDWLAARLPIAPATRRATILLSHDVDDPIDPADRNDALRVLKHGLLESARCLRAGEPRNALSSLRTTQRSLAITRRHRGDRHWLFSEVLAAERRCGFHSTFFFAVTPYWRPGASYYDVNYDARTEPFAAAMREIVGAGSEVGLHLSYRARESAARIGQEREALQAISGQPVLGTRHHYWHMDRPFWATLDGHARAGLRYDASTAFNECPGYRLGIAFPFRPWNPDSGSGIPALQLPTVAMDAALVRGGGNAVDSALERFDALLSALKRYRGVAALDWHVRTSYPGSERYRAMGETYLRILETLAADPDVEVASCREACERFG